MTCANCQHWARDIAETFRYGSGRVVALSTCRAPMPHSVESSGPMFSHGGDGCPCFKDAGSTYVPQEDAALVIAA